MSPTGSIRFGDDQQLHTVAVAALQETRFSSLNESSPLYLIIDGNIISPRVQFDKYATSKAAYDPSSPNEDEIDINDVLPALDAIERAVDRLKEQRSQRVRRFRDTLRRSRPWRFVRNNWPIAAVIAVILLVTLGVGAGCSAWNRHEEGQRQQAAEYARDYDAKHLTVKGEVAIPGRAVILANDLEIMASDPPSGSSSDTVSRSPRSFSIEAGSCISTGRINTTTERVVAVSDAPASNAVAFVSTDGKMSVCAVPNNYTDSRGMTVASSYTVVVQAQDNK